MRLSEGEPVIITNNINKTVLLPFCDNKCVWNKQKSVIIFFTKIWQSNILHWQKQKHQIHWIKYMYLIIWVSKFNVCIKQLIFNTSISNYSEKKHLFKFFRQSNYTEKAKILYFLNLLLFKFGRPMTTSCDLFTTDRPYVMLYNTIYKKDSKQIWISVSLLSIFFLGNFTHVSKNRQGT